MLILISLLAFYLAWNLGANDVANSMGTSVGSKAITLRQALLVAGVLEFTGAVLFGQGVSETLATKIVSPEFFVETPQVLLLGMVVVLITCGAWLQFATALGLPVSSSHAVVGAIAGFGYVAVGNRAIDWQAIGVISLTWVITPVVSGVIAALFYSQIKQWILEQPNPLQQLREWIPWLSSALLSVFGVIVLPTLSQPLQTWLVDNLGVEIPAHDLPLLGGAIAAISLSLISWRQLERLEPQDEAGERVRQPGWLTGHRDAAESATQRDSNLQNPVERQLARFQVLSACFVAFAHGSNDVGNAVAPLAAIAYIRRTGMVPREGFEIPLWILILGGVGIVAGLAVWGKRVILTIGEGIISLRPSGGFCAELAAATTVLLASRAGLPVSTSHALVGGVVGIGLIQSRQSLDFKTLREILFAWCLTIPIAAGLSAGLFAIARQVLPSSLFY